MKLNLTY